MRVGDKVKVLKGIGEGEIFTITELPNIETYGKYQLIINLPNKNIPIEYYPDVGEKFIKYAIESNFELVMPKPCLCGAKYTSRPKFHLSYCDLD